MKNFNIKKVATIVLDIILIAIIAGAVLFGFLGINKTAEAKGGVEVRVCLDEVYQDDTLRATAQKDIENILKDKGYKVIQVKREIESTVYNTLVFCVQGDSAVADALALDTTGSVYDSIKTYLETENPGFTFNDDEKVKEFRVDFVGSTVAYSILRKAFISFAIIFVACVIYFAFRFGIWSAIVSFIATIVEFAFFNAVIILTRIPTDGTFYLALFAVLLFSLLASIIYNGYFRIALKGPEEKSLLEHAQSVSCKAGKVFGGVIIATIVALLIAIIAVPTTLKLVFSQIALGALLVGVSAVFTRPALRYWFGLIKKTKKTGYSAHAKQKENKD